MKNTYTIETLQEKDYEAYRAYDLKMPAFFIEQLQKGIRTVYLYLEDGVAKGEIALVTHTEDSDYTIEGQQAYLSRLVVSREYRNQGIGAILIEHVCEKARQLGYERLSLGVYQDNEPAMHLYKKHGFLNAINESKEDDRIFVKLVKVL